jgi:IS5 family transposase
MTYIPSNVHDSKEFDKLLGKQNNKVLHRAYRNTPLTDRQKQENKQPSMSFAGFNFLV